MNQAKQWQAYTPARETPRSQLSRNKNDHGEQNLTGDERLREKEKELGGGGRV